MGAAGGCNFDSIIAEQDEGFTNADGVLQRLTVVEASANCKPSEHCLAAYLAAAEPYTYLHCMGNGENLLGDTVFPEMDYPLGSPSGKALEVREGVFVRKFGEGGGSKPTIVTWDNNLKTGTIDWAHL